MGRSVIWDTDKRAYAGLPHLLSTVTYSDIVRLIKESDLCHKRRQMLLTLPSRERQLDRRISGLCLMGQSFLSSH